MKKFTKKFLVTAMVLSLSFTGISPIITNTTITAQAHSGRTDGNGGHKDNHNKSGLGGYHYHCGGYDAHLHNNGVCPYSSSNHNNDHNNHSSKSKVSSSTVKKVQTALNKKGYDCGTPDGIMGSKTKEAIKKFQADNGLTVDGVIGKQVLKALNI